jgi:hypothetical protein
MELEVDNEVESFEEVAMTNPFKTRKSLEKALSTVENYSFTTQVYSHSIMEAILESIAKKSSIQPPKTIFVPSRGLLRTIIRAAIKFGKKDSA